MVKHKLTSIFYASSLLLSMNFVITWNPVDFWKVLRLVFSVPVAHLATSPLARALRCLKPYSSLWSLSYSTLKLITSTCGKSRKIDFNSFNWRWTIRHARNQWVSPERMRARNMFDKAVPLEDVLHCLIKCLFDVVQTLSNTIQHDRTRCPNGKIFGHKTMFERV